MDPVAVSEFGLDLPVDDWMLRIRRAELASPIGCAGSYELMAEVGRGGQGIVYQARQPGSRRCVAVKKVIGGSSASLPARWRLERELETASSLQHPSIVNVLGVEIADGQPLLAMEWIDGVPVTQWAAGLGGARQPVDAIVTMFRTICDAVQHAHQRGVIHRDIKPSNILVDAHGHPHVLDFGLATFAGPDAGSTPHLTQSEEFLGTIAYASPEQLRCRPDQVEARSDVYALGVILYEMLTGKVPHAPAKTVDETLRQIEQLPCIRPSRLREGVPADLDAIALKALHPNVNQRYQSVDALASDLDRYRHGEPVTAHGLSYRYLFGTWLRRHRVLFAIMLAALLLIVVGGLIAAITAAHLASARQSEREARWAAEQMSDFLQRVLSSADPVQGSGVDMTARQMLDSAAERLEDELVDQPLIQAELRQTIGTAYASLGVYEPAEHHLRQALEVRRRHHGARHLDVAETMYHLANVLRETGSYQEAESLLSDALDVRRELAGPKHPDVAAALDSFAQLRHVRGEFQEAERKYREALGIRQNALGQEDPLTLTSIANLATLLMYQRRMKEARPLFEQVLEVRRRIGPLDDPGLAAILNNTGLVLQADGEHASAEAMFREALEIHRARLGHDHPRVAIALTRLASVLSDQGQHEQAVPLIREAMVIYRQRHGEDSIQHATVQHNLGLVLMRLGEFEQAEPELRRALEVHKLVHGDHHRDVGAVLCSIAELHQELGRHQLAEETCLEGLAIQRQQSTAPDGGVAMSLFRLGRIRNAAGRPEEAEAPLRESEQIFKAILPPDHLRLALGRNELGESLSLQARYEEAEPLLVESLSAIRAKTGPTSKRTSDAVERVISLYENWGKAEIAGQYRASDAR
ncbi:MAG: tetratricopeptide repeat protein [Phycisphaerales bacterium]|nr:tetratricopeptide repeat protein [Phycisphaerales bacterium]MCI0629567.1 tetratricopeptide repeat protein [Phycisphaerales bacterium]